MLRLPDVQRATDPNVKRMRITNGIPSAFDVLPPRIKERRQGGLHQLRRILGLRRCGLQRPPVKYRDPIFVSIDLERMDKGKPEDVPIREYGVTVLDSLDILRASSLDALISTRHFSTIPPPRECFFAKTQLVSQNQLLDIIRDSLQIRDTRKSTSSSKLRNIMMVGHSVKHDLRSLQRLGLDYSKVAPVVGVLDTYIIARHILRANMLEGSKATVSLTLGNMLKELDCKYDESGLHNAGNDATYTMYALLLLGIKSCQISRFSQMDDRQLARLQELKTYVQKLGLGISQEAALTRVSQEPESELLSLG